MRASKNKSQSRIVSQMRERSIEVAVTVRAMMSARCAHRGDGDGQRANIAMRMMRGGPRESGKESGRKGRRVICASCVTMRKGGLLHG
jgi:hypothetical protein